MALPQLFSIGEMAKIFHLSVSSLRHYEALGLVTPEYVDPSTNYRYYSVRQFEPLNTIRYLRAMDMPLTEIADFLQNRDVETIEEKLRAQKAAVVQKQKELKRIERKLDALAALKLHAGPGFVQRNIRSGNQVQQVQEKEVRFIFDQDVYSTGKVKVAAVAETLNALHAHSDSVFSDAITTVLHDAMEPEYL